jgi:hypothetical protein
MYILTFCLVYSRGRDHSVSPMHRWEYNNNNNNNNNNNVKSVKSTGRHEEAQWWASSSLKTRTILSGVESAYLRAIISSHFEIQSISYRI